jgi:hypothetical protein
MEGEMGWRPGDFAQGVPEEPKFEIRLGDSSMISRTLEQRANRRRREGFGLV